MENQNFIIEAGAFFPQEAKEVLISLINNRIKYHRMNILSISERDANGLVEPSKNRIEELKKAKEKIKEIIDEAEQEETLVEINSSLEIKIMNNSAKHKA